jgi:hypothetical protein
VSKTTASRRIDAPWKLVLTVYDELSWPYGTPLADTHFKHSHCPSNRQHVKLLLKGPFSLSYVLGIFGLDLRVVGQHRDLTGTVPSGPCRARVHALNLVQSDTLMSHCGIYGEF